MIRGAMTNVTLSLLCQAQGCGRGTLVVAPLRFNSGGGASIDLDTLHQILRQRSWELIRRGVEDYIMCDRHVEAEP